MLCSVKEKEKLSRCKDCGEPIWAYINGKPTCLNKSKGHGAEYHHKK